MIVVTVTEILEIVEQNTVTVQQDGCDPISLNATALGDLTPLVPGQSYTLSFVPFVEAGSGDAHPIASKAAPTQDTLVPADHPVVMDPTDATMAAKAVAPADKDKEPEIAEDEVDPSTVEAPTPNASTDALAAQATPNAPPSAASSTAGDADPTASALSTSSSGTPEVVADPTAAPDAPDSSSDSAGK